MKSLTTKAQYIFSQAQLTFTSVLLILRKEFWLWSNIFSRSRLARCLWVYGSWLAGIADSNSAGGTEVCLFWVLCFYVEVFGRADHSSGGVLPTVVCLNVIVKRWKWEGPGILGCLVIKRFCIYIYIYIYVCVCVCVCVCVYIFKKHLSFW
jgi:hypothetical protein